MDIQIEIINYIWDRLNDDYPVHPIQIRNFFGNAWFNIAATDYEGEYIGPYFTIEIKMPFLLFGNGRTASADKLTTRYDLQDPNTDIDEIIKILEHTMRVIRK